MVGGGGRTDVGVVWRILDRGLLSKYSSYLRTASIVVFVFALGRLLGFVRDLVIARYFGATSATDAFLVAWMIPETVTPLFLDGAMLYVFIPWFARELEKKGTIKELLPLTFPPVAAALLVLSAAVALSAPWTVPLLVPGLSVSAELAAVRMVSLVSITIFFIGLAGYAQAALNSRQIFSVPAMVFAAYNIGILGSILLLHERLGIYSAALGLALGSALMLLVQVPTFVRKVGVPRLTLKLDRTLLHEFAAFVPIGAFVLGRHLQVYVERFFGSFLDPGTISHLGYAFRIGQLPVTAVAAIAYVSFPAMSRAVAASRTEEIEQTIENDLKAVIALILPAAAYLIVFAPKVVAFLLERGAFTAEDTTATAPILSVYALGLLANLLIVVILRPTFTYQSSMWLPVRAALVGLAVTLAVDVALLRSLGAVGLAAGNVAGMSVIALLLLRDMKRYLVDVNLRRLANFFFRAFCAVLLASWCTLPLVILETFAGLPTALVLIMGGVILSCVYLLVGRLFGIKELKTLQNQAMRMLTRRART